MHMRHIMSAVSHPKLFVFPHLRTIQDTVCFICRMSRIIQERIFSPVLQLGPLFQLSPYGAQQRECLRILHSFTDKVIQERKANYRQKETSSDVDAADDDHFNSSKSHNEMSTTWRNLCDEKANRS